MEKIPKYIFIILLVIGYLSVRAQDVSTQLMNTLDPKLAPEQGGPGSAISNNPAKPVTPLSDPKLNTEKSSELGTTGSTIQKPPIDQLKDPKLGTEDHGRNPREVAPLIKTQSKVSGTPAQESNAQPAAGIPKNNINYRTIKGEDTQPAAVQPVKATSLQKLEAPNTQPEGEKPKR